MKADFLIQLLLLFVVLCLGLGIACLQAHQEAKTYNRITGANVTTWEALWVELRIDSNPQEAGK